MSARANRAASMSALHVGQPEDSSARLNGDAPARVLIVGAGALGSWLGARLALAGVPVRLVARGAHAEAIRRDGLLLRRTSGDDRVAIEISDTVADAVGAGTVVFLTCKAYDVDAVAREVAGRCGREVPVVCWQNGVRSEEDAAEHCDRVYSATTSSNANLIAPGVVVEARLLPCSLGRHPGGRDALCDGLARMLIGAGVAAAVEEEMRAVKWCKIFGSVLGTLLAVVDRTPFDAEVRPLMTELLEETLRCLRAANVPLKVVPGQPDPQAWVEQLRSGGGGPSAPPASASPEFQIRTSTWQDLTRRRGRNEAEYLNGAVIALAERAGVDVPLNRGILRALHKMADEGLGPGAYTIADLRREVARS